MFHDKQPIKLKPPNKKERKSRYHKKSATTTILDINYVDFLQFQRHFRPQAELEEAFIYIIRKPIYFSIDFSCRLKT